MNLWYIIYRNDISYAVYDRTTKNLELFECISEHDVFRELLHIFTADIFKESKFYI